MLQKAIQLARDNYFVISSNDRAKMIYDEIGFDAFNFIRSYADIRNPGTYLISAGREFEINKEFKPQYNSIIDLIPIDKNIDVNDLIKNANQQLKREGMFIGCFGINYSDKKFSNKKNKIHSESSIHDILLQDQKQDTLIYDNLRINSKKIFKAKMNFFGRFCFFGFEIISENIFGNLLYFVAKKISNPSTKNLPSASPLIRLNRIGKHGKIISIYKFRTMYPYSEYLQNYIFKHNNLESGGKFKNDYRIIRIGNLMRKYWIDEIPMLINLLKGDIKLFGVRPLSEQYFNLYTQELKELRIKFKPGLIPPYYADLPNNFESILSSEKKYLEEYQISPIWTDFRYLLKVFYNIFIKCTRSK